MTSMENADLDSAFYESLTQVDFKKTHLRITGYYAVLRERLHEAYGDRVYFRLTSVPSYTTVYASEYALSFAVSIASRLLLSAGSADRLTVSITAIGNDVLLSLSAAPYHSDALHRALSLNDDLLARISENGGFSCSCTDGDPFSIAFTLSRSMRVSIEVSEGAFDLFDIDPFALGLSYPLNF